MKTTVVHNQTDEYDVYIGREVPDVELAGSKWGNPFVLADDSEEERRRSIANYRTWILTQPDLLQALEELRGKRLGCWCAPLACHGDVLVELLDARG